MTLTVGDISRRTYSDELKKEAASEQNPTGVLLSKSSRQVKAEKREEEDEDKYNKKFEDEVEPG